MNEKITQLIERWEKNLETIKYHAETNEREGLVIKAGREYAQVSTLTDCLTELRVALKAEPASGDDDLNYCHCHPDTQAESMDDPNECGNCGRLLLPNDRISDPAHKTP